MNRCVYSNARAGTASWIRPGDPTGAIPDVQKVACSLYSPRSARFGYYGIARAEPPLVAVNYDIMGTIASRLVF